MCLCRLLAFVSWVVLAAPAPALDDPNYADPATATIACEAMHKAGLEDKAFIVSLGQKHFAAWRKAAEGGDKRAQWLWGRCVQEGVGGPSQPEAAVAWFRKAAEQGSGHAMNSLGECYAKGIGVPASAKDAVKWYQRGMVRKNGPAIINLGKAHMTGTGIDQDYVEGAKCFLMAAKAGYAEGAHGLGELAENGRGTPRNKKLAARWYEQAWHMGMKAAEKDLYRVTRQGDKTATQPPEGARPPADAGAAGTKPPADPKPPTNRLFRGQPAPGIAVHPLGPAGFHGPAPTFAGTWSATLKNEDEGKEETLTYAFDDQGTLHWKRKTPMDEVGRVLSEETLVNNPPNSSKRTTTLLFFSVQPRRIEYIIHQALSSTNGDSSDSHHDIKRLLFTPVPGKPDRLKLELWVNKGTRPAIQGELVRQ